MRAREQRPEASPTNPFDAGGAFLSGLSLGLSGAALVGLGPLASSFILRKRQTPRHIIEAKPSIDTTVTLPEFLPTLSMPHVPAADRSLSPGAISWTLVKQQDDRTSEAVISFFQHNELFHRLSRNEVSMLRKRDAEDAEKLGQGIAASIRDGVISSVAEAQPVTVIPVDHKSAEEVADEVLRCLPRFVGGRLLTFQGLSGTGKGTTVRTLKKRIPNAVSWSNGNIFRALTLLLLRHCEEAQTAFHPSLMTRSRVQRALQCLTFGHYNGRHDILLQDNGDSFLLSEVENTLLKAPHVTRHLPTVAERIQGEVILFATKAVQQLCACGMTVLLEGRAETLRFFPSSHRFELAAYDTNVLGRRRSAQRVMAQAWGRLTAHPRAAPEDVAAALHAALSDVVAEHAERGASPASSPATPPAPPPAPLVVPEEDRYLHAVSFV